MLVVKNCLPMQETQETGLQSLCGEVPWRRAWQLTPVFLPGESHGHRSLAGYNPWGRRVRRDRRYFWSSLRKSGRTIGYKTHKSKLPPSLLSPCTEFLYSGLSMLSLHILLSYSSCFPIPVLVPQRFLLEVLCFFSCSGKLWFYWPVSPIFGAVTSLDRPKKTWFFSFFGFLFNVRTYW